MGSEISKILIVTNFFFFLSCSFLLYFDLVSYNFAAKLTYSSCFFFFFLYIPGFPDSSVGKESTCNAGDPGSTPRSGGSLGEGITTHSSILGLPWWLSW